MQTSPSAESPEISYQTSAYQIPARVLIRIWWRRLMFSPRVLVAVSVCTLIGAGCLALPDDLRLFSILPLFIAFMTPINAHRSLAKSVHCEPQWTDPRTLDFSASRLIFTGPDWRNEMAWSRFKGFSEDTGYFYLHLRYEPLVSVIPKSAFTPGEQEKFRECAKARYAR